MVNRSFYMWPNITPIVPHFTNKGGLTAGDEDLTCLTQSQRAIITQRGGGQGFWTDSPSVVSIAYPHKFVKSFWGF